MSWLVGVPPLIETRLPLTPLPPPAESTQRPPCLSRASPPGQGKSVRETGDPTGVPEGGTFWTEFPLQLLTQAFPFPSTAIPNASPIEAVVKAGSTVPLVAVVNRYTLPPDLDTTQSLPLSPASKLRPQTQPTEIGPVVAVGVATVRSKVETAPVLAPVPERMILAPASPAPVPASLWSVGRQHLSDRMS